MQTACVIPPPLGFVCSSPSHPTTQYPSQSPLQQTPQISSTPRNGRRRSARNSVQLFISSVIQYATDQSISPSSPLNPPSQVEFEKRDMASTTAQDCSHPKISLLTEMLRRQMIGGIGNCRDSRIGGRGIQFDCASNKSRSVFTTPNNNVSGRKCLKFGDCPSVVRQPQQMQQQRQSATILANTNETVTTHAPKSVKPIDNDGTLKSGGNGLTTVVMPLKKGTHFSPPPTKSLYLRKTVEDEEEEEREEEEEEEEEKDDSDDEDGYLEDDEDDQEEEDDDDDDEEEEDDDGEELTLSPQNLTPSFNSTTRPNIKIQIHPISIVETTTSSEQEQTTATSSHYSTALSIPTSLNNINRPIRKAKSLPYRVIPGDATSNGPSDWHHNEKNMPPLVVRRRKLGVKSIPIPKTLNSHHFYGPCHNGPHKRRHGHRESKNEDALWIDIISARRVRMAGAVDKSKEDNEEDVLWPLSI
jgi:hypothetical protein